MVIVLSFTGCIAALRAGNIAPSDLDGAFFWFGCSREVVFEAYEEARRVVAEIRPLTNPKLREVQERRIAETEHYTGALCDAVAEAEEEGRVGYRKGTALFGPPAILREAMAPASPFLRQEVIESNSGMAEWLARLFPGAWIVWRAESLASEAQPTVP